MASRNEELLKLRNKHVPQGPFNITTAFIKEARGAVMIDVDGRKLIDFAGGIGVNNVGHCHPKVVAAIKDQAEKYIHTCFHVAMYEPYVELAVRLNELAPGNFPKMTMFANSGAEAVENAVKVPCWPWNWFEIGRPRNRQQMTPKNWSGFAMKKALSCFPAAISEM